MSDNFRYTRSDVNAHFARFIKAIGGRVALSSRHEPGTYRLDHASTYGGYCIMRDVDGGGETHVCGALRRGPSDFMDTLSFAIDAIAEARDARAGVVRHDCALHGHAYRFSGEIPCTGPEVCIYCGLDRSDATTGRV